MEDDGPTIVQAHLKPALTPPTSEEWNKPDGSSSDLSDFDLDDDEQGAIEPDHYFEGGRIPVFKPTMEQFRSFKKFIGKIDKYGMKSGIVKVVPPKEWIDSLPPLDEAVKSIKVKNPITQEFSGIHGTYTQANIEKQRSYNLPQWKALTEESQHQPPAKRGEKRQNQEKPAKPALSRLASTLHRDSTDINSAKRRPGRPRKTPIPQAPPTPKEEETASEDEMDIQVPPTPTSPIEKCHLHDRSKTQRTSQEKSNKRQRPASLQDHVSSKTKGRQPKSVTERRKYNRRETENQIDESAFEGFDYRAFTHHDYTIERCNELETLYWKSLTFAPPMYGADMPGSLFDDTTTSWNVAKLENLLDVLGQNVPGVNTAYLYLGMWKATFAWHLEDVDLYSINYIHFGAPKQWYSISQEDARRFETAMKNVWPNDAKNCSQFLRHKTYLISPAYLKSQYNITVNKLVHYEGEFVITFPYGYHSGYNLGYNCAESVNFATEAWLDYGKIAKKCDCEADSVWIDVAAIEHKLRGEPTPEYYEETDDEDDHDNGDTSRSSPATISGRSKLQTRKRKRGPKMEAPVRKVKKIRIRIRNSRVEPCLLCPNEMPAEDLLPTDAGRLAHRMCALYTPETYIWEENGIETVCDVSKIDKARLDLKCSYCRSKKGACFQCSSRKCTRAYHATCAAVAGVQIEYGPTPVYGEDGTEYFTEDYDFRCRFHRTKRSKTLNCDILESSSLIRKYVETLKVKEVVQAQHQHGEIFAGTVVEKRSNERTLVIDILPEGDRLEVEWKWLLVLDPADSQLVKPSPNAKPLPDHIDKLMASTRHQEFGPPLADAPFCDPNAPQKWAEFNTEPVAHNPAQAKVDLTKDNQIWHYLGRNSTDARPQFTEDPAKPRHNPLSNFLDIVKPVPNLVVPPPRASFASVYPPGVNYHALNGAMAASRQQTQIQSEKEMHLARPYHYKPKLEQLYNLDARALDLRRSFMEQGGQPAANTMTSAAPQAAKPSNQFAGYTSSRPTQFSAPRESGSQPSSKAQPSWSHYYQRNGVTQQNSTAKPTYAYGYTQSTRDRVQSSANQSHLATAALPQVRTPRQDQLQHQAHHQQGSEYRSRPQQLHVPSAAPMAKMGSAASINAPAVSAAVPATAPLMQPSIQDSAYLDHIKQYPYLLHSHLRKPQSYTSPYKDDGSFSEAYMPDFSHGSPSLKPHTMGSPSSSHDAHQRLPIDHGPEHHNRKSLAQPPSPVIEAQQVQYERPHELNERLLAKDSSQQARVQPLQQQTLQQLHLARPETATSKYVEQTQQLEKVFAGMEDVVDEVPPVSNGLQGYADLGVQISASP